MAERLADALEVDPDERDRFVKSAHAPLTPLIGRGAELHAVLELLACGGGPARLVTLTGPPGVGKTRFGLEVLTKAQAKFDAPGVFVGLATETDPDALPMRVARALNVPAGAGDRVAVARRLLRQQPVVLLLDNVEQLTPGAGRHISELAPLATPPDDVRDPQDVLAWPAAEVF